MNMLFPTHSLYATCSVFQTQRVNSFTTSSAVMALCSCCSPLLSPTRHRVSVTLVRRVLSGLASRGGGNCDMKPPRKPHTPVGKYDEFETHAHREKEPLEKFPDDINPHTGERGGPRGPEPTRYGDWERKGRCVDF